MYVAMIFYLFFLSAMMFELPAARLGIEIHCSSVFILICGLCAVFVLLGVFCMHDGEFWWQCLSPTYFHLPVMYSCSKMWGSPPMLHSDVHKVLQFQHGTLVFTPAWSTLHFVGGISCRLGAFRMSVQHPRAVFLPFAGLVMKGCHFQWQGVYGSLKYKP